MKALYIPAALLVVILGFSLWAGRYVDMQTGRWTAQLEEAGSAAAQEDWPAARDQLRRAYEDWDASATFFHTIMNHSDLDEAESLFQGAMAVCSEEDDADFHLLLAQLTSQLRLLAETQSISIKNIL